MSFELILPFLRPIESLLLDEGVSEIMGNAEEFSISLRLKNENAGVNVRSR